MENSELEQKVLNIVDHAYAKHIESLKVWEKALTENVQKVMNETLPNVLRDAVPEPISIPFWKQLLGSIVHGIAIGIPLAVMYLVLK